MSQKPVLKGLLRPSLFPSCPESDSDSRDEDDNYYSCHSGSARAHLEMQLHTYNVCEEELKLAMKREPDYYLAKVFQVLCRYQAFKDPEILGSKYYRDALEDTLFQEITEANYLAAKQAVVSFFRNEHDDFTYGETLSKKIRLYEETFPLPDLTQLTEFSSCNQFCMVMKKVLDGQTRFEWLGYDPDDERCTFLKFYIWETPIELLPVGKLSVKDLTMSSELDEALERAQEYWRVLGLVKDALPNMHITTEEMDESGAKFMFIYFPGKCTCEYCSVSQ
jgi:hypothetical protein